MAAPDRSQDANSQWRVSHPRKDRHGGMGSVYRANQTAMSRLVAVKIFIRSSPTGAISCRVSDARRKP